MQDGLNIDNPLARRLSSFGISEEAVLSLAEAQIETAFHLLLHVPKSIIVHTEVESISSIKPGAHYILMAKVDRVKITGTGKRSRLSASLKDLTGIMDVVFFGPAVLYARQKLKEGMMVRLSGEVKEFLGRSQMVHPKFVSDKNTFEKTCLSATYPQIAGLTSEILQKIVSKVREKLKDKVEHLADHFLDMHSMVSLDEAIKFIHSPKEDYLHVFNNKGKSPHFRRLAFEELIGFYIHLLLERKKNKEESGPSFSPKPINILIEQFFPYMLTTAQRRVIEEILHDLAGPAPMCRLLQGDVGSGKTAVSAAVAKHVIEASWQVAIMAPTEILAEQLFNTFNSYFAKTKYSFALLTAQTKSKERKIILAGLKNGEIQGLIGTHALLSDILQFDRLGLVIIDEQHRFGVNQRALLINSAEKNQKITPHLLAMSATPIPRSLALTYYGDLALSILDERPAGRLPIHTQMMVGNVLDNLKRLCDRIVATNRKTFIVFPLLEESEYFDLENASKAVTLIQKAFGVDSCMLLHGKMKHEEKSLVMEYFRHQSLPFLVATTVVEVGIDVPDASCMIIVHPERFGLSQLHQLRGRVGRGQEQGYCFLLTEQMSKFSDAYKRLNALCQTNDGFKLAEIDLSIRGPGQLLGTKQSGLPNFSLVNHDDFPDLFPLAKDFAQRLVKKNKSNNNSHLFFCQETHFS